MALYQRFRESKLVLGTLGHYLFYYNNLPYFDGERISKERSDELFQELIKRKYMELDLKKEVEKLRKNTSGTGRYYTFKTWCCYYYHYYLDEYNIFTKDITYYDKICGLLDYKDGIVERVKFTETLEEIIEGYYDLEIEEKFSLTFGIPNPNYRYLNQTDTEIYYTPLEKPDLMRLKQMSYNKDIGLIFNRYLDSAVSIKLSIGKRKIYRDFV